MTKEQFERLFTRLDKALRAYIDTQIDRAHVDIEAHVRVAILEEFERGVQVELQKMVRAALEDTVDVEIRIKEAS